MDKWAKNWLEKQREQGTKCLEIKVIGKNHYAYHSTTYWDKELKKPRKTSKYLGKLDKTEGLIESRKRKKLASSDIRNVTEYGNSMVLHESMKSLKPPLIDAFPDCWEEIYSLAMVRINGYVPMKRAKESWEKLYNVEHINPQLNPKNLSKVLHSVGINRVGQNAIFKKLVNQSNQLVYDLSSMFTRSMSIAQAEKGYNKNHLHVPQINLALLCSADTGLPAMIRSIPGSVRDIATLYNSIKEIDAKGKTLILDRGFFSDDTMEFLEGMGMSYILPTRRNSRHYKNRIHLNEHFTYHKRLIRCGKKKFDNYTLYLFDDQDLKLEEQKTLYKKLDEGKINKKQLNEKMKRAGQILIVSNMDVEEYEIFELFKKREFVEKMFDTYKTVLDADKLYLQSDESVFGHVFISFISLYIHCIIENLLKKAGLNSKMTPIDLLHKYGGVYHIDLKEENLITEVPKKVRELDEKLGLDIFPKKQS
ncbi:MAG TPA: hypothetical protein C5S51_07460 [Methanosarcinaceae archaeon]|nr:hypothetical protein [Methanosarcinaceae archaeon]